MQAHLKTHLPVKDPLSNECSNYFFDIYSNCLSLIKDAANRIHLPLKSPKNIPLAQECRVSEYAKIFASMYNLYQAISNFLCSGELHFSFQFLGLPSGRYKEI